MCMRHGDRMMQRWWHGKWEHHGMVEQQEGTSKQGETSRKNVLVLTIME